MTQQAIFLPAFAMAALTFAVVARMYVMRIAQMKRDRIHPQSVATSAQANARLTDSRASDNLRNLFELPVLFYLVLVIAATTGGVSTISLLLAWTYVVLRVVHSAIQCTYNKVMHRFFAHMTSNVVLLLLWVYVAMRTFA